MSKTVRTGARHGDRVGSTSGTRRDSAQASAGGGRPRDKTATGAARAQAGNIPSTLDPDLDQETNDIESELEQRDEESHMPPEDEIPEEEIADEVVRAAEGLPAEVPVDKADRTDDRDEHPPNLPRREP
ncbi:hypothetical protein Tamer19_24140 [Cupriavidus sp. TA19]|uniref:hypothetical protein n=1 Tax=unclassified Cupriavidus TaxID=2640874 RepID=UPI000E2F9EC0|nr:MULTISPECIES: hypothetical protein [unclassified Cupriavidus]BDB27671.1 hypothetical protein CTP10_R50790 [Cupriavidus sp. P-10]GLC93006.1 hypothetical protein Tamer19_24140 [Cupriavidus sp. TA19]